MNPWICPKCGAVFGPSAKECRYCNRDKQDKIVICEDSIKDKLDRHIEELKKKKTMAPYNAEPTVTEIFLEDDDVQST